MSKLTLRSVGRYTKRVVVHEFILDDGSDLNPVDLRLWEEWEPEIENQEDAVWYFDSGYCPEPEELKAMGLTEEQFIQKCKDVLMNDEPMDFELKEDE